LTEAIGLSLPGNGTVLATHTARRALYERAGATVVELTRRYYDNGDVPVPPRDIATRAAFEKCHDPRHRHGRLHQHGPHLLAAAREAGVDYTLPNIDALSHRVPVLCKVAPNGTFLTEDVHRAGGIPAIVDERHRGGLLNDDVRTVHAPTLADWLTWDVRGGSACPEAMEMWYAAPGCKRSAEAFSQSERWESLDTDAAGGCIRGIAHAYFKDGGLAVLGGNLAAYGAVVETAGVDESIVVFEGPAVVCESQEQAVQKILGKQVKEGDVVVVRYEGPGVGLGCRRCSTPPLSSRAGAWAQRARWSPMAASPAAPRACRSATSRRRPRRAAPSPSSRTATPSVSISPTAQSNFSSTSRRSPP
jgi:dihydroxy-acid dehydratase